MNASFRPRAIELQPLEGGASQAFELLGEIARGGMGVVFRARQPETDREVAIKVVRAEANTALQRERFLREGQITARLDHPGIVRVHAAGTIDGRPALVYELIEGARNLGDVLRVAPLDQRLALMREGAVAVGYAHELGVVHRDLKPDNVLVDARDQPRVADFGVATAADLSRLTQTGAALGTLHYMAPEQLAGQRVGPQSDVWSLGVMLYQALVERLPFDGASPVELAVRITEGLRQPPSAVAEAPLPNGFDAVCERALATEPEARYSDARALAAAIGVCLETPASVSPTRAGRLGLLTAAALASVALVTAALGLALWTTRGAIPASPTPTAAVSTDLVGSRAPDRRSEIRPQPKTATASPTLGRGFGVSLPATEPTLWLSDARPKLVLAHGQAAVWVGGSGWVLRHARRGPGELGPRERVAVEGRVEALSCAGGTLWALVVDPDYGWRVTRREGQAWRTVWRLPEPSSSGVGRLSAQLHDGAIQLVVAQHQGAWSLRLAGDRVVEETRLATSVEWVRGLVHDAEAGAVVLGGNAFGEIYGAVAAFDRAGQVVWADEAVPGTVMGLARLPGGLVAVANSESTQVECLGPQQPRAPLPDPAHDSPVRDVVRAGPWLASLAYGEGAQVAELHLRRVEDLELVLRERLPRGGGGQLAWDHAWNGLWVLTPTRLLWRPVERD